MAGDPTGMRGAQTRDGRVEQAGRAKRAGRAIANVGKGVWARVPGTDARAKRLAGINAEANRTVNQQLLEGMVQINKPAEEQAQKGGGALKGGDSSEMGGGAFTDFAKIFRETLKRGRSMDEQSDVQDSLLRQVLCHKTIIDIVKDATIAPTPVEREQPGCFAKQREQLAGMLEARTIGNLTAEQLDILFVTMVGKRAEKVDKNSDRYVAFWSRWPQDSGLPTPDQAFFQYLESVASKQATSGGKTEGRYIGEVLKAMGEFRTLGDSGGGVRSLMDHGYADEYLKVKAAAATDRTVGAFEEVLESVMSTPANQIHAETGVPGLGFAAVDPGELEQRQRQALEGKERVDALTAEMQAAGEKKEEAAGTLAQVRQMVAQIKAQGTTTPEQLEQANETLDLAEIEKEQADAEYDEAVTRRTEAHGLLKQLVANYNALATEDMAREKRLRSLVDTFRDTLLEQSDASDLKQLPDRMQWAQNPEVKRILEDMDEVLADRELLRSAIGEEYEKAIAQKKKDEPAPAPLEVAEKTLSRELAEQKEKVEELKGKVESANLPEEVKAEMRKVLASVEDLSVPRAMIEPKKDKVRRRYAYPLVEVTKEALKKLEEDESLRIGEISDKEWVIARTIWERSGEGLDSKPVGGRKFWDRLGDGIIRWTTTLYGVKKVFKFAAKWSTLAALHRNLISKQRREPIPNRKENGEVDEENPTVKAFGLFTLRQFHKGLLHLMFLAYLTTTFVIGMKYSPSLSEHYWRGPIESRAYLVPAERRRSVRRVIGDSYDIPDRLKTRGNDYYREAYGVTQEENLDWLAKNDAVLRFFQERRTLKRVRSWERLEDTPQTCSTKQAPIPASCKALGLENEDDIANYSGGRMEEDAWQPGKNMPVCCFVALEYEQITDGRVLNRNKADEFVSYLRTQASGKAAVDGEYLNGTENMITWTDRRFLISKQQNEMMETYGISEVENIEFAVAQKAHLSRKLLPLVVAGDAERFLKEDHRDEFLTAWRSAIVAKSAEADPRLDTIADGVMDETFDAVLAANKGWTRDTTTEYREKQLSKELTQLNIQTQTSRDIYIAQEDIRGLLQKTLPSKARYVVNPGRSDELVRFLDRQKRDNTPIAEFDPFADPPGRRAQALINAGLIGQRDSFEGTGQRRDTSDSKVRNAMSEDAQSFYADESYKNFNQFIDTRIEALFDDQNVGESLRQAYGGDREATKRAIKDDIHKLVTSTTERDARLRDSYGISVTREGEQLKTVEITDARRARRGLTTHITRFIRTHGRDTQ